MAHQIKGECVFCGSCADACPVNAISEGPDGFKVDPDTCIDCGACEGVCPSGAIVAE